MKLLPLLSLLLLTGCPFAVELGEVSCWDDTYCPSNAHCEGEDPDSNPPAQGVCAEGPGGDDDDATADDDDATADDDDATADDDDATADDDDATPPDGGAFISEFFLALEDDLQDRGWVEVTNMGPEPLQLEGMRVSFGDQEWTIDVVVEVEQNSAVVLGRTTDPQENGGIEVAAAWGDAFNFEELPEDAELPFSLLDADGVLIDSVTASPDMPVSSGVSTTLGRGTFDGTFNDDPANWCFTQAGAFGDGFGMGDPGSINLACPDAPLDGSYVITELFLNPNGSDGVQWVEILNATSSRRSLKDLELGLPNATAVVDHHAVIEPGGYAVFAGGDANINEHGFNSTFAWPEQIVLPPDGEDVSIKLDSLEIDRVDYGDIGFADFWGLDGQSFSLPFAVSNSDDNDNGELWCAYPSAPFNGDGDLGTPGEPNPDCDDVPTSSEVAIQELFLDLAGELPGSQWIEVRNTTAVPVNLEDWSIETANWSHQIHGTVNIAPFDVVVLAQSEEHEANGGFDPEYFYGDGLELDDFAQYVELRDPQGGSADSVEFANGDFPQPVGASVNFHGNDFSDATDNDDPFNWCVTPDPHYGDGVFFGSPGDPNLACPGPLQENDLVITEAMIDPSAPQGWAGEWIEIHSRVSHTVSLQGYTVEQMSGSALHTIVEGVVLAPGGFVVLGGSQDLGLNGGVEPDYAWQQDMPLNFGDGVELRNAQFVVIDELNFGEVNMPSPQDLAGVSLNLDPSAFGDPAEDDVDNYCPSPAVFYNGSANRGTPGFDNPPCFDFGDDDDSFGDDDDSFGDDDDSFGDDDDSVTLEGYSEGDLIITEIMYDPSGSDTGLEWFEVFNASGAEINLDDWDISFATSGETRNIAAPEIIAPGEYFVFGQLDNAALNGGVVLDWAYSQFGAPSLDNSADTLSLLDAFGAQIDSVTYDEGIDWPAVQGYTLSLDPALIDHVNNDDDHSWCETPASGYGSNGDHGNPGQANDSCGDPWWRNMGFCMQFDTFTDANTTLVDGLRNITHSEPWLMGVDTVDVPGNSLSGLVATTPNGSCQDSLPSTFLLMEGVPDVSGMSTFNVDELVLAGVGSDVVFEYATLSGEFQEGAWELQNVSLEGSLRVGAMVPQYPNICSDYGCTTCVIDPSEDCAQITLSSGVFYVMGAM